MKSQKQASARQEAPGLGDRPSRPPAATCKLVVGLTGGMASGKSTVARLLEGHGALVIDADEVARFVVEPGQVGLREIERRFGPEFIDETGRLRRKKLGEKVFRDEAARRKLESILHPLIRTEMRRRLETAPSDAIVVLDVPLLFESREVLPWVDLTVVVYADRATQLSRMQARDGLSGEEAERRLQAQWPLACKLKLADHVIYNQSDRQALERQVADLWERLERHQQAGMESRDDPWD